MTARRLLALAFGAWARRLVPFTALMLAASVPALVWLFLPSTSPDELITLLLARIPLVLFGVIVISLMIAQPAAGMGRAVVLGIRRVIAVIVMMALVLLAVIGAWSVVGAPVRVAVGRLAGQAMVLPIAAWLGTAWWLAVPVLVVEDPGVIAALRRSRVLTMGYRSTVLAVLAVLAALWAAETAAIWLPIRSLTPGSLPVKVLVVLDLVLSAALHALFAVAAAVGYVELRRVVDGTGATADLARVFE